VVIAKSLLDAASYASFAKKILGTNNARVKRNLEMIASYKE
jgi:hypothetical protein